MGLRATVFLRGRTGIPRRQRGDAYFEPNRLESLLLVSRSGVRCVLGNADLTAWPLGSATLIDVWVNVTPRNG